MVQAVTTRQPHLLQRLRLYFQATARNVIAFGHRQMIKIGLVLTLPTMLVISAFEIW